MKTPSNELSLILDEIENSDGWTLSLLIETNALLVKALRKAMITAKIMPATAYERIIDNFKVDMLANDMQADYDTMEQEVAAILNQGRAKPDLEVKDA